MPNDRPQPPHRSCSRTDDYPNDPSPATTSFPPLLEKLIARIGEQGPLPFSEYMEIALYDPEQGYYATGVEKVGREGDFFTSVSVGPLFGKLLAHRFVRHWEEIGQPERWRIMEVGAHDGKLATDILLSLKAISEQAWGCLEYAIPEPLSQLREAQENRLTEQAASLRIEAGPESFANDILPGIIFGNEILDALPFHLIRIDQGKWVTLSVTSSAADTLALLPVALPQDSPLSQATAGLGPDFPEGYQTEVRTGVGTFLDSLRSGFSEPLILFFDYGFAAPEYYDISRTTGTLRTFSRHRAAEDPLDRPGCLDITAHVDFTSLAHEAGKLGLSPTTFSSQSSYLTHLAKPLILDGHLNDAKDIAQFQTLTHPAHLGGKFHAIELRENSDTPDLVKHRLALD